MRYLKYLIICLFFVFGINVFVFAEAQKGYNRSRTTAYDKIMPQMTKGAKVVLGSFQVKEVKFETVVINGQSHLTAAVIFNGNIDASTVQENVNIRLLKQDDQGFWVDVSTQNNTVNVRPNFITWVSGAPLANGVYKMHLRGTIKRDDGQYLDCDGDGRGEGGYAPAYESQLHRIDLMELDPIEGDDAGSRIEDLFGG